MNKSTDGFRALAMGMIYENALEHADDERRPDFHMLAEEVLELSLSLRGQHEDSVEHELTQIGGIVLNWLADRAREGEGKLDKDRQIVV